MLEFADADRESLGPSEARELFSSGVLLSGLEKHVDDLRVDLVGELAAGLLRDLLVEAEAVVGLGLEGSDLVVADGDPARLSDQWDAVHLGADGRDVLSGDVLHLELFREVSDFVAGGEICRVELVDSDVFDVAVCVDDLGVFAVFEAASGHRGEGDFVAVFDDSVDYDLRGEVPAAFSHSAKAEDRIEFVAFADVAFVSLRDVFEVSDSAGVAGHRVDDDEIVGDEGRDGEVGEVQAEFLPIAEVGTLGSDSVHGLSDPFVGVVQKDGGGELGVSGHGLAIEVFCDIRFGQTELGAICFNERLSHSFLFLLNVSLFSAAD